MCQLHGKGHHRQKLHFMQARNLIRKCDIASTLPGHQQGCTVKKKFVFSKIMKYSSHVPKFRHHNCDHSYLVSLLFATPIPTLVIKFYEIFATC